MSLVSTKKKSVILSPKLENYFRCNYAWCTVSFSLHLSYSQKGPVKKKGEENEEGIASLGFFMQILSAKIMLWRRLVAWILNSSWKLQGSRCSWTSQWVTFCSEEEVRVEIIVVLIGEPVFFLSKLTEAPIFLSINFFFFFQLTITSFDVYAISDIDTATFHGCNECKGFLTL